MCREELEGARERIRTLQQEAETVRKDTDKMKSVMMRSDVLCQDLMARIEARSFHSQRAALLHSSPMLAPGRLLQTLPSTGPRVLVPMLWMRVSWQGNRKHEGGIGEVRDKTQSDSLLWHSLR